MTVNISPVRTDQAAQDVRVLAYEFVSWLNQRYPEMADKIADYLANQKFEDQIKDVRLYYSPPGGECLLASVNEEPVGILMLKDLGGQICEMNRMYVRESGRGLGVGRKLVQTLKTRAVEMGFKTMVLSALPRHHEALALYKSTGFQIVDSPEDDADHAVHMSMEL